MITKQLFDSLKTYRDHTQLVEIGRVFPVLLSNFLCLLSITIPPCIILNLKYSPPALMSFQLNFGHAIATENFDNLDDILLQLLSSYYCIFPPYEMKLSVCERAAERFRNLCQSFANKSWSEICEPLIDGIYDLLRACTVDGHRLNLE